MVSQEEPREVHGTPEEFKGELYGEKHEI